MKKIYGVPDWLMKKYLADLGAEETATGTMVAADWSAEVRKAEPARIGSLKVGRIEVMFDGEAAILETLLEDLHWKTMRGGG